MLRLFRDEDHVVRQARKVGAARRGRAVHDCDLRDAGRRAAAPGSRRTAAALDEHLALVQQVRAARLDQVDQRQLVLLCDLLRAQRLFQPHGRDGAALDRAVARETPGRACRRRCRRRRCVPPPMARDAPSSSCMPKPASVDSSRNDAPWSRSRATRSLGRSWPALCKPFGLLRRMRDHGPFKAAEFFHPRQKMRGVGLEGFRLRRYPRGDQPAWAASSTAHCLSSFFSISGVWRDGSPRNSGAGSYRAHIHQRITRGAAPSMGKVTPEMKAAPSLNRKQIAALTSASVPRRLSGTWSLSFGISAFTAPS